MKTFYNCIVRYFTLILLVICLSLIGGKGWGQINININSQPSFCYGSPIFFVSWGVCTGATYQWNVNGKAIVGDTLFSCIFRNLNNNDTVTCTQTNNAGGCSVVTSAPFIIKNIIYKPTISLSSSTGTDSQTVCQNLNISNIVYTTTGTNGVNVTGLPNGINYNFNKGKFTVSGSSRDTGTFNYTVFTYGGNCGEDTLHGVIRINQSPQIKLTSKNGSDNQSVCFNKPIFVITYSITGASGVVSSTLPNGITGTFNSTTGIYTISGTSTQTGIFNYYLLTSVGGCGLKDSVNGVITINPNPKVSFKFTPNNACGKTNVQFTNTSTIADGTFLLGTWNWGDGIVENNNANILSHYYVPPVGTGSQNYTITLIDSNYLGCKDSTKQIVTIGQRPDASLDDTADLSKNLFRIRGINGVTYFEYCSSNPFSFTFYNNSSSINTHYHIDWGDSTHFDSTAFVNPITHQYSIGLYNLTFTVTNLKCTDVTFYKVFVGSVPAGGLDPLPGATICNSSPFLIPLTNSVKSNATGTVYIFHTNDGSPYDTFYQPPPDTISHFFKLSSCSVTTSSGSTVYNNAYGAYLDIINPCGSGGSTSKVPIYVSGSPYASFIKSDSIICVGNKIRFDKSLTTANDVEDAGTGTGASCDSGKSVWTINPNTPGTPWITNNFLGIIKTIDPSRWTNGDNIINVEFDSIGTYTINVKAGGNISCGLHDTTETICVNPTPIAKFQLTKKTVCAGDTLTAINKSPVPLCGSNIYKWTVTQSQLTGCKVTSTPLFVDSSINPVFKFSAPGIYVIGLVTTIKQGSSCSSLIYKDTVTVNDKPVVSISSIGSVCQFSTISPSATATCNITTVTTYSWSFPGSVPLTSTSLNPGSITMNSLGTNIISFSATNSCGTSSTSQNVVVNPTPVLDSINNIVVCAGATIPSIVFNSNVVGTTYSWTNSNTSIGLSANGINGSIGSFKAVNTTNAPITATITVNPTFSSCPGKARIFSITVNPTPTVSAVSNIDQCSGTTISGINFTGNIAAASYGWTNTNSAVGIAANGNGNINAFPANNAGTSPITGTVTVTPNYNSCPGTSMPFSITIDPVPTLTASVSTNTVCSGNAVVISMSSNVNGASYLCTSSANGNISGNTNMSTATTNNSITDNLSTTSSIDVLVTYTITIYGPGSSKCIGNTVILNVTVKPGVTASVAGVAQNLCNQTSVTLAGNTPLVGTGTWSSVAGNPTGAIITSINQNNTTVTGLQAGIYVFQWTINGSSGSCPSSSSTVQITNRPTITVANAGSNIVKCDFTTSNNNSVILTGNLNSSRPFESGLWTIVSQPPGGNGVFSNATIPTTTFSYSASGTYLLKWTITNDIGCTPSSANLQIKVYDLPIGGSTNSSTIVCKGNNSGTITMTGNTGTILKWQYAIGNSINWVDTLISTTTISYLNLDTTKSFRAVIASLGLADGCNNYVYSSITTITVNPTPVISGLIPSNPTQCSSATGSISFNVLPITGNYTVNYLYNNSPKTITVNIANGVVVLNNLVSGIYSGFSVSLNSCSSNTLGAVTLNDPIKPSAPIITAPVRICSGNNLLLDANTAALGASYTWSGPNSFISTIKNPTIVNANTLASGFYSVHVTINKCNSNDTSVSIIVDSTPVKPTISGNNILCSDSTLKLTATTISAGTMVYNWTTPTVAFNNTAAISITNVTSANTGIYNVTATSTINSDCISGTGSINVVVNPTPVISGLTSTDPTLCASATGTISFNVVPASGLYTVQYTIGSSVQTVSLNAVGGVITIPSLIAGVYSNITVITANSCPSNKLGPITLKDPTSPTTPIITAPLHICSGQTLLLDANTSAQGVATYNWSGPNGFGSGIKSPSITNATTAAGGVYTVNVTIKQCKSNDTTANVVVDSTPAKPTISGNNILCSDSTLKLTVTTVSAGTMVYNWTTPTVSFNNTPTISIANVTSANTGVYNVTATSTINSNCISAIGNINVVVNPTPVINGLTSTDPTLCASATGTISFNVVPAIGLYSVQYTIGASVQTVSLNAVGGVITIPSLIAGVYSNITVITANSCPSKSLGPITLKDPTRPLTPIITAPLHICSGQTLVLDANTLTTGIAIYNWSGPNGFGSGIKSPSIINATTAAGGVYTVNVTIKQCKSNDTTATVVVDSTPAKPTISGNNILCSDSTLKLTATTVSAGIMVYNWTTPTVVFNNTPTITIPSVTITNTGVYTVTATSTINSNCISGTGSINVLVNPTPVISYDTLSNPTNCKSATGYILIKGLTANTTYGVYYSFNGGAAMSVNFVSNSSGILKIDNLFAGTYSNIYVASQAGCPSNYVGPYTLTDPNPPATPSCSNNGPKCSGQPIQLSGATISGVASYQWNGPNGYNSTLQNPVINNTYTSESGNYSVTATINSCTSLPCITKIQVDSTPLPPQINASIHNCSGNTLQLSSFPNSSGTMTYSWSGPNGFKDSVQNPVINNSTIAATGLYNVIYTSVIGSCISKTSTINVVISPTPTVDSVKDSTYKNNVNSGLYTFTGSVAGTTFWWTNSNTAIGLGTNGKDTMRFITSNTTPFPITGAITVIPKTDSCTGNPIHFNITVNPTPKLISPLFDSICTGRLFTYQALSATANVKYVWTRAAVNGITNTASNSTDSSGAISEILYNPTTAPIPVIYVFTLIAADGSKNNQDVTVLVYPDAKSKIIYSSDLICAPGHYDSIIIKPGNLYLTDSLYIWYANNQYLGTSIHFPGFTINNPGDSVAVKLVTTSLYGCKSDSSYHEFYTIIKPIVSFTKSRIKGCGPLSVTFTNTTTPINEPSYEWDFGNGIKSNLLNPPTISYVSDTSNKHRDTTYYITLKAFTQCDTLYFKDSVIVKPTPKALFQPDTTVGCSPFKFFAINNSLGGPNTYNWSFGDGALQTDTLRQSVNHIYHTGVTDTFTIKLVAVNTCGIDSFKVDIVVYPNTVFPDLIVNGQSTYACAPQNVQFVNNSSGGNYYSIDFGDNSPIYISNQSNDTLYHYYPSAGNYSVVLFGTNGCSDTTRSQSITIYPKPTASFSISKTQYCVKELIQFNNSSSTGLQYYWKFGDGFTSTLFNPTHDYTSSGIYTVILVVSGKYGTGSVCTDTFKMSITINPITPAVIKSNVSSVNCEPFTFISNLTTGLYASADWIFSNPYSNDTIRAGNQVTYTYSTPDIYSVTLMVVNSYGCKDTAHLVVTVNPTPKASFAINDTIYCAPTQNLTFNNTSTYTGSDFVGYAWYVNGVLAYNGTGSFLHTFNAQPNNNYADTFKVLLRTTSSFGCNSSYQKSIILLPKPNVHFNVLNDSACAPATTVFIDQTLYANNYSWYLDGALFSTIRNPLPILLPTQNTNYVIKLIASSNIGCGTDSFSKTVVTYRNPIVKIGLSDSTSCNGHLDVIFTDQSISFGGTATGNYYWTFGDGGLSNSNPIMHSYNYPGDYTVTLTVYDSKGCKSDVGSRRIAIFGSPTSNFATTNTCEGLSSLFTSYSKLGIGSTKFVYQAWDFGDGNNDTGAIVNHIYTLPGIYTVKLTVLCDSSCIPVSTVQSIVVYGKPHADFSSVNNCAGLPVLFTNHSQPGFAEQYYQTLYWYFGDGTNLSQTSVQHIYSDSGDYKVMLIVTGYQCGQLKDTMTKMIHIVEPRHGITYPLVNASYYTPTLLTAMNDGVSYNWTPTTGLSTPQKDTTTAFYTPGVPNKLYYTITITDSNGCVIEDKQEVWVFAQPDILVATGFTPNGDGINDYLIPNYINIRKLNSWRIYDRWGNMIFQTNDMHQHWDGKINGVNAPMETYTWVVEGVSDMNQVIVRKGMTTLIRD